MSVMNGFRTELINRILGLNGHIGVFSATSEPLTDYNRVALKLAELPNVIAATPRAPGDGSSARAQTGAVVRGVSWSDLAARKPLWDSLSQQAIAAFRDYKQILIGETMAFRLGLKIEINDPVIGIGAHNCFWLYPFQTHLYHWRVVQGRDA